MKKYIREPYIKLLISVVLLATGFTKLPANERMDLHFENLNNTNGLPTNAIRRIIQDREGYMWFASNNGVIKYDGYNYESYCNNIQHPAMLSSNIIRSLADSKDYVWIGTDMGLNKYIKRNRCIEFQKINEKIDKNRINKILVENESSIWLATSHGIVHFNPQNNQSKIYATVYGENNYIRSVQDICLDSHGRLWFCLWNDGIVQYERERDLLIRYPAINEKNSATTIFEDKEGSLWIGSWGYGLFRMIENDDISRTTYVNYTTKNTNVGIRSNYIYAIEQDKYDGNLWIGHRKGLTILSNPHKENASFSSYTTSSPNGQISDLTDLNTICIDHSGIIWLGNLSSGIHKVNLENHPLEYNQLESIHQQVGTSHITSMLMINPNLFWFGIRNNGVWIYDKEKESYKSIKEYLPSEPLLRHDAFIMDIKKINSINEIWVAVRNKGVFRIRLNEQNEPVSSEILTLKDYASKTQTIHEDKRHNIWLLTSVGVCIYIKGKGWIINDELMPSTNYVAQCCAEDREGNMWVGTKDQGIYKFIPNNDTFTVSQYSISSEGSSHMDVTSIFVDSKRQIWASTNGGGLNLYDRHDNTFKQVNTPYHIPYDMIYNIFEDESQTIWLNNENALIRLNTHNKSTQELNVTDKLWDNMFTSTCDVQKLPNNKFMIGGAIGYNILNCSVPIINPTVQTPAITNVYLSGESIYQTHQKLLSANNKRLKFNHKENDFTFTFSSLVYDNPGKHRYLYRLKGYDDDWHITLPGQHMASYTKIPHGHYVFQLKMASNDQDASTNIIASWPFAIAPSIFDTWYAWTFYILLTVLILFILLRTIYGRMRLKRQVALAKEREKNAEALVQTKLRFFTNISHDLLTPLTVIECALENIKQDGVTPTLIHTMQSNINYLTRLLRQILEFRKMENDKLKLKIRYGNISELVRTISQINIAPLLGKKNLSMHLDLPEKDIMGWFDSDKLDKITYNLLSNAYKYNRPGGSISISLSEMDTTKGKAIRLQIADTGIGIAPEQLPNIFNRFYDGEYRKQHVTGTGIGLSLVKGLVELHGGDIKVSSTLGKGSTFTIELPIDVQAFEYINVELQSNELVDDQEKHEEEVLSDDIFGQGRNVLLVDDNPDLLIVVSHLLRKYYHVTVAENGEVALQILHEQSVDLVVSDVMMPQMDGFELCKAIKADIRISHIPIILLTAKVMENDRMNGYDVGAIGYITKPFAPSALLKRISSVLRNKEDIMSHYLKQESPDTTIEGYTSMDNEFFKQLHHMVLANLDNSNFDLEFFANEMGMSKSTLYRKIKEMTQMSPVDFIKDIRLKQSKRLLREKMVNVSQVAYAVGFSDPKYFSKCFKKAFDMSPNEYIKSLEESNQS